MKKLLIILASATLAVLGTGAIGVQQAQAETPLGVGLITPESGEYIGMDETIYLEWERVGDFGTILFTDFQFGGGPNITIYEDVTEYQVDAIDVFTDHKTPIYLTVCGTLGCAYGISYIYIV